MTFATHQFKQQYGKQLLMKPIILMCTLLLSLTAHCQDKGYAFRYQIGANERYKSATAVEQDDPYAAFAISLIRKRFFSTVFLEGKANDRYLECKYDLSQLLQDYSVHYDTNSLENFDFNLWGFINGHTMAFQADDTGSSGYYCDKQNDIHYTIKNDTIDRKSASRIKLDDFAETKEQRIINNWLCVKWIPKDTGISEKVAVWISKDIPKAVNFGISCPCFDGGLVKVEWANGRFNLLTEYQPLNTSFDFAGKNLLPPESLPEQSFELLRGPLIEADSMTVIKQ